MRTDPHHSVSGITISRICPADAAYAGAFCFALTGQHAESPEVETHRRNVAAMSASNGVESSVFVATNPQNAIEAAALLFESPGRSALVHLSPKSSAGNTLSLILDAIVQHGRSRKLNLLQMLLQTGDTSRARLVTDMQFQYLAELIYMDCPVAKSGINPPQIGSQFRLFNYNSETEPMFLAALENSYKNSLDCPALTPLRTAADALAGHKSTGIFDPSGFYVIATDTDPIAILLTSRVADRSALEVVYMGVSCSGRKRGLGSMLLALAKHRAMVLGVSSVTLAVDAINTPARRLYGRAGFEERARRRAWIRCI